MQEPVPGEGEKKMKFFAHAYFVIEGKVVTKRLCIHNTLKLSVTMRGGESQQMECRTDNVGYSGEHL